MANARALRREIWLTIASTLVAILVAVPPCLAALSDLMRGDHGSAREIASGALGLVVLLVVTYGVAMHHLARIGYLKRLAEARPASAPADEGEQALLTILVPAYKENPAVVRKTLLSAALQETGPRRVVLLIDDPPAPISAAEREDLFAMRRLASATATLVADFSRPAVAAAAAFAERADAADSNLADECQVLSVLYRCAAEWLEAQARPYRQGDHADRFFAEVVLGELERRMIVRAESWSRRALEPTVDRTEVQQGYRNVLALGRVEIASFERKRYANLSHAPNKAMNLNGYLSLMIDGGSFCEERHEDGIALRACEARAASLRVPFSPHVLMVDADTVLTPDYAARMLGVLRRPENGDVAVVQAPYAAFPGAPAPIERIAGATTDVQYLVHQGMSLLGATFWVGANAVVRTAALRDVATTMEERGWTMTRVLHDRTVIEDTETSLELRRRGWRLHSHDERLAFSATPADFGALLVQRLRWANGGLLLVPRLARALSDRRAHARSTPTLAEAAMRLHYLVALGPMSLALVGLPFCAFTGRGARALPLLAVCYLAMYLRDLLRSGYSWPDLIRVYALNLVLIPVNLGGLLLSLRQLFTDRKPRFVRTPKMGARIPTPGVAIVAEVAMLSFWFLFAANLIVDGRTEQALLVLAHVVLLAYAITRYIGWRAAIADLLADLHGIASSDERLARRRARAPQSAYGS